MVTRRTGIIFLLTFTLVVVIATLLVPPIPQWQSYHNFADRRGWLGIPNFGDVSSNALFAVAGAWGLVFLFRDGTRECFLDERERWAYVLVFLGLLLTAFGSSYYHLAPDDARLVWDRLPMTISFMALVAAMIAERIEVRAGVYLLPLLILVGIASVLVWWYGERQGAGDLRFYAAVQVYAVLILPLMLLLPPRYTRSFDFAVVFAFYVLAKICELTDRQIFSLTRHAISGHTVKHLAAGVAGFWILGMLKKRQPAPSP
ncbi:MAG TPA: hypothetical protein VJN42_01320 [Candidatus Acidoferrum sp.]|nr:hypothetical protein [Candidatus Acidoferrum sp.]